MIILPETKQNGILFEVNADKEFAIVSYRNRENPVFKGEMKRVCVPIAKESIRKETIGSDSAKIDRYYYTVNGNEYVSDKEPEAVYVNKNVAPLVDLVIPAKVEYEGKECAVRIVDDSAFKFCASLRSVEFPETLTSVNRDAFLRCPNLKTLILHSDINFNCGNHPESIFSNTPITDIYLHYPLENANMLTMFMSDLSFCFENGHVIPVNCSYLNPRNVTLHVSASTDMTRMECQQMAQYCNVVCDIEE